MTITSTIDRPSHPDQPRTLEQHFEDARHRIQVNEKELDEARRRRQPPFCTERHQVRR